MDNFELTLERQTILNHSIPGHGRVLAGPGTGKSATAVALAEKLLSVEPNAPKLKFLTFTRAATHELAKKLSSSKATGAAQPSTIHSFSISTLIRNPGGASFPQPLRIPDSYEYDELIRQHLAKRVGVGVKKFDELVAEMSAKWESLNPEEKPNVTKEERARFMGAWHQHRYVFGYTLLAELPDLFRCALRDHDDLVGIDFDLLIVDEFQDLNACDLEVLRSLANRGASILAIGDDDQSIYSFRKAHPAGIRQFLINYQTNSDYSLTICRRSAQCIMDWAQYVIQGDPHRVRRNQPQCTIDPEARVGLLSFRGDRAEAQGVVNLVCWLHDVKNIPESEILVLSRTDRHGTFTRRIKDELGNRNIPVSDPKILDTLLNQPANRKLIAILRLIVNETDSLAWWTLMRLEQGIGDSSINAIYDLAIQRNSNFGETFVVEARNDFPTFPDRLKGRARSFWLSSIKHVNNVQLPIEDMQIDWGRWILNEIENTRLPACTDELGNLLVELDCLIDYDCTLDRYLSQIQPLGRDSMGSKSTGVRFMTMIGSKGLTVQATIIIGVENDLIPRPDQDVAEERRLLYVAMTRSRKYLFLTWSTSRLGPAARSGRANIGRRQPSEFLRGGPVQSQDGPTFIASLTNK